ncbi:translocon component PTEX150, putative [Plasmodium chabaudi adami]|uniref:Translocon component PTEX150, putative n=1 Tax=Plasmodium chabaudi adami TaxID=5826 RepID=A0A1D3LK24_PLACE|nr:translocon component PTEX150, putative [Plasmodium chabaudi adami]
MKILTVKILAIIALINYVSVSASNKNCSLNIKATINKGKDDNNNNDNNDESITPNGNEDDDKASDNDGTNNNVSQDGDALNNENADSNDSMQMENAPEQPSIELSFDKLANGDKIKSMLDSLVENDKNGNGNNGKDMYKVMMSNIFNGINNGNDSTDSQNDEVNDVTLNISQENREQLENLKKNIEKALKERGINIDDLSKKYMNGNTEGKDAFIQLLKNMSQDDDIAMNIPDFTKNGNFPDLDLPNIFNLSDDEENNSDNDIIAENNESALNAKNENAQDNEDAGEGTSKDNKYTLLDESNSNENINENGQTSNDGTPITNADNATDSDSSYVSESDSDINYLTGSDFSETDSSLTNSESESDAEKNAEKDAASNEKPTQEVESSETDDSEEELIVSSSTNNKQKNNAPSLNKNELLKLDNAKSSTSKTDANETHKKATKKTKKHKKKSGPSKTNLRRYPFEQSKINEILEKFENSDFYKSILKDILDKYVTTDGNDNKDVKNNNEKNNNDNNNEENDELNIKEFSVKDLKKLLEDDVLDYSDLTEEELTKLAGPDKAFYDLSPYANEDKEFSVNEGSTVENEQLTNFLNKYGQYHMSYDSKTLDYLKQKKSEKKEEDQDEDNFYDAYKQIQSSYSGIPSNYYHQAPQLIGDKYVFTSVYDQKKDLIKFLKRTNGKSIYVHPENMENGSGNSSEMKQFQKLSYYKRKNAYNILVEQRRIEKEEKEEKEKKAQESKKAINDDYIKHLSNGGLNKSTVLFSKDDLDKMVNGLYSESGNSNGSSANINLDNMATNIKNSNNGQNDNKFNDSVNDDDINDNELPEDNADEDEE